MTWNWSANRSQSLPEKQRERFASPFAIFGLIGAGFLLLTVLYPEKSLLRLLTSPEVYTPAQQNYLEILLKMRAGDPDLVFSLARSYLSARHPDKAQQALRKLPGKLTPQQLNTALALHYEVLLHQLKGLDPVDSRWSTCKSTYAAEVGRLLLKSAPQQELWRYRAAVQGMGNISTSQRLELRLKTAEQKTVATSSDLKIDTTAEGALARGDYRRAAAIHFQTMQKASGSEKRRIFLAGVQSLVSGNLPGEAFTAAEANLDALVLDRELLIFMTRLALAANRPERARHYIRMSLDMTDARNGDV